MGHRTVARRGAGIDCGIGAKRLNSINMCYRLAPFLMMGLFMTSGAIAAAPPSALPPPMASVGAASKDGITFSRQVLDFGRTAMDVPSTISLTVTFDSHFLNRYSKVLSRGWRPALSVSDPSVVLKLRAGYFPKISNPTPAGSSDHPGSVFRSDDKCLRFYDVSFLRKSGRGGTNRNIVLSVQTDGPTPVVLERVVIPVISQDTGK